MSFTRDSNSSHNDHNLFEVAYALKRQFGEGGIYQGLPLVNFADNHDVPRVASILSNAAHLYPLQLLLFTVPGVPSIYYGSEWGLLGTKGPTSDAALRPALTPEALPQAGSHPDLFLVVKRLIELRQDIAALRLGDYREMRVASNQLAFSRSFEGETVLVAVNIASEAATLRASNWRCLEGRIERGRDVYGSGWKT